MDRQFQWNHGRYQFSELLRAARSEIAFYRRPKEYDPPATRRALEGIENWSGTVLLSQQHSHWFTPHQLAHFTPSYLIWRLLQDIAQRERVTVHKRCSFAQHLIH
jgi:hypothetical protein